MNREIKFRAYALDNDYPNQTDCIVYEDVSIAPDGVNCGGDIFELNNKDFFISQYIGRKDKNGIMIFEGDIVEITFYNYGKPSTKIIKIISFEQGSYTVVSKRDGLNELPRHVPIHWCKEIEIIGNKFESPELLENK